MEEDLVAAGGDDQFHRLFLVAGDAAQFSQGPGGDDDTDRLVQVYSHVGRADRQAEPVGSGQREAALVELGEHAGQDRATFVGGGGKDHLVDHVTEGIGLQVEAILTADALGGGHLGKFAGINTLDVGLVAGALEIQGLGALHNLHLDLAVGQRVHKLGEQAGWHGDAAFHLHPGADPAVDTDLEVGGGHPKPTLVALEQDVGQNRKCGAAGHCSTDGGQSLGEVLLQAADLHIGLLQER